MRGADDQSVRAELVGEAHANLLAADARVHDLPNRLTAERDRGRRRERIEGLRTRGPRAHPVLVVVTPVVGNRPWRGGAEREAEYGRGDRGDQAPPRRMRIRGEPVAPGIPHGRLLVMKTRAPLHGPPGLISRL